MCTTVCTGIVQRVGAAWNEKLEFPMCEAVCVCVLSQCGLQFPSSDYTF